MARNGSGTYSLPAGNPVVDGTDITVTWGNDTMNDIATALTNSLAANGETPVTANIPMAGFKLTGVGSATALTDATTGTDVQKGTATYLTSAAGTNTYTATGPYSMAAYTTGQILRFIVPNTSTSPTCTLNVNSIGAKDLMLAPGIYLPAGALRANFIAECVYDGTKFQVTNAAVYGSSPIGPPLYDHGNSGTTQQDLAYSYSSVHRIKATGNFTIITSAWPASGVLGEMLLYLVADGTGRTITYTLGGTTTNFVKTDGTFVTTPALSGVTMQTANDAIDFIYMWSTDGGTTVYAKVLR